MVFQHNRGAAVAVPSFEETSDLFELRGSIERLVIGHLTGKLTAAQISKLRNHLAAERRAYEKGGRLSIELATQFHLMLADMTGSSASFNTPTRSRIAAV